MATVIAAVKEYVNKNNETLHKRTESSDRMEEEVAKRENECRMLLDVQKQIGEIEKQVENSKKQIEELQKSDNEKEVISLLVLLTFHECLWMLKWSLCWFQNQIVRLPPPVYVRKILLSGG